MWNSAHVMEMVNEAKNFGVETSSGKFDWPTLKEARDSYITRLNGIYERNLGNSGIKIIQGVSEHNTMRRIAAARCQGWTTAQKLCYPVVLLYCNTPVVLL